MPAVSSPPPSRALPRHPRRHRACVTLASATAAPPPPLHKGSRPFSVLHTQWTAHPPSFPTPPSRNPLQAHTSSDRRGRDISGSGRLSPGAAAQTTWACGRPAGLLSTPAPRWRPSVLWVMCPPPPPGSGWAGVPCNLTAAFVCHPQEQGHAGDPKGPPEHLIGVFRGADTPQTCSKGRVSGTEGTCPPRGAQAESIVETEG